MADVCADLIDELRSEPGVRRLVAARIFAGKVPPGTDTPFIWLQRRSVEMDGSMEVNEEPLKELVALECVSDDPTEAVELSDAVRSALDGRRGLLGWNAYAWVGVSDVREGYIPKNLDADEILHISSLDVEVIRP